MHPIDRAAGLMFRTFRGRLRVFTDGWGDPDRLELLDVTTAGPPAPIEVTWGRPDRSDGVVVESGEFASSLAGLPPPARIAHVRRITPEAGCDRICVLLPAWNDEDYRTRTRFAQQLVERGIGAVLLGAAFYGTRRVAAGGSAIRTVSDFALMSRAIVAEGRSLVAHLAAPGMQVGVAGYSMGGSLAATVAATTDLPIAVAPLAAAHAPSTVFVEGVLQHAVEWEALGAEGRTRLFAALDRPSLLRLAPTPATRHAVLVAASGDGFVLPEATRSIHDHWPGSELRVVRAGHASMLWWRLDPMVDAIVDAFDRAAAGETGGGEPGSDPA
jgi:dienelactone hydrolase